MSEFSNISSLKLLRSVELFSRLTILQLSQIADSLVEISFSDGQHIINKVCFKFRNRLRLLSSVVTVNNFLLLTGGNATFFFCLCSFGNPLFNILWF